MKVVPFLVGPTASGKTAIALMVARRMGAQIISADSRQIYRAMAIGSAQPRPDELARIPHHFIGCLNPDVNFSAGEFGRQARAKIAELQKQGIIPLVVGGSGLYVSALADDFFSGPSADPTIRTRLKRLAASEGVEKLYSRLREVDPASAEKIMPSDYRRIERALEIFYLTGLPISELRKQKANPPPYRLVMVGLEWPREQLYERINLRCLKMLEDGLVDEVRTLLAFGQVGGDVLNQFNALNSVGYAEVIQYLQGKCDYAEMVRLFQRNTRRFAKRQISWFGRDSRIHWVKLEKEVPFEEAADSVSEIYSDAGIEFN